MEQARGSQLKTRNLFGLRSRVFLFLPPRDSISIKQSYCPCVTFASYKCIPHDIYHHNRSNKTIAMHVSLPSAADAGPNPDTRSAGQSVWRPSTSLPGKHPLRGTTRAGMRAKRDNFGGGGSEKETPTLVKDSNRRQRARLKSVKKISQSQARHTESTPVWLSRASVIGLQVQQPAEVEAHNYMSATKLPNIP